MEEAGASSLLSHVNIQLQQHHLCKRQSKDLNSFLKNYLVINNEILRVDSPFCSIVLRVPLCQTYT